MGVWILGVVMAGLLIALESALSTKPKPARKLSRRRGFNGRHVEVGGDGGSLPSYAGAEEGEDCSDAD